MSERDEALSDGEKTLGDGEKTLGARAKQGDAPASALRSRPRRLLRGLASTVLSLALLLVLLLAGFAIYTTTPDFQHRVGAQLVTVLEDATGGKVELGHLSFDLWHLALEVDGLVIHGLEAPGEAPYLAADKILVRLKILSFFAHTAGTGPASHISLSFLRVEHPSVHLIIDKQGKTNQPVPKHPSKSNESTTDTLLDLRAGDVALVHGVALLNDRAIPFNLAAQDLNAQINYLASTDRYGLALELRDLRTQIDKEPEAKSNLHLEAELGRDLAELKAFDFHTGEHSELQASGAFQHFAHPEWQAKVVGSLELKQISILSGFDGLDAGSVELDAGGHNCYHAPAEAQKQPDARKRLFSRREAQPSAQTPAPVKKVLPPDPDCQAGYLLVGTAKLHNAGYHDASVRLHDINGSAQLHITPTQLLLSALTGYLPGGGSATGELKIDNWLGEVPANTPPQTVSGGRTQPSATVQGAVTTANKTSAAITGDSAGAKAPVLAPVAPAHAYLTVVADRIPLRTILEITAPKTGDLGFDTGFSGPVKAEWGGPVTGIGNNVSVDADVRLAPTGSRGIPVRGEVAGRYDGSASVVRLTRVVADTPQSTLTGSGVLGVAAGDGATDLAVDLQVRELGEYDQLLRTLGVSGNGKKGSAALPIVLHGTAGFHGTARGALARLDVKGHLEANNLEVRLGDGTELTTPPVPAPPSTAENIFAVAGTPTGTPVPTAKPATDVHIDSLVADAEYTPAGLAVASSTITRGSAVLHLAGAFHPRVVVHHRATTYVWDNGMTVDASVQLARADVADVLAIAGQQAAIPLTGTINVDAHAAGTLANLNGAGTLTLVNGVAYGEPYQNVNADLTVKGRDIEVSRLDVLLDNMAIHGNGGYDLTSERLHAHLDGKDLQLSRFKTVHDANLNADGILTIAADANGTVTEPNLKANLQLAKVTVQGKPIGDAEIDAHSEGKVVFYALRSNLVGAQVAGDGQTELTGNYLTQAKLSVAGLDVGKPLALFSPDSPKTTSKIAGNITLSGPAKLPMQLAAQALFSTFEVTSENITLRAAEPLSVGLRNGVATLNSAHITGPDTDLRASGTVQVFGATDPKTGKPNTQAGKVDVKAQGSIGLALAHSIDPALKASGRVTFDVAAGGVIADPALTGAIKFQGVDLAVDGVANGLTNLNGSLSFAGDRINVDSLVGTTGGGQLTLGGFATYRGGFYADLTANADAVRVRYNGLSGTANAKLRLQGDQRSSVLSGNILLTRFGVGADVDFAAFGGGGGVSAPPDPESTTNKIRLDVHVNSSPQLDFQNSYAKLAGTVDLTVRGTVAEPSVLGRVQITDGSATFAGTKYQLQRGDIYFTNPVRIDPVVDLDATARVENYDLVVGLHGTTTNLKPTYRSEPPLSEADIFALLALGRTQEESQLYQEQQIQAGTDPTTSSLLGGALNATVSNRVSKLFGVGSVKIDPAFVGTLGNSSARITVQQQLSRQLTLTYATNVNSSAQQLIQVAYQVSPNVSIVAARDESGVFSIVYKIRRRYR